MRLVIVEWTDSGLLPTGWHSREDVHLMTTCHPVSVGILYEDRGDEIVLVADLSPDQISRGINIPKCSIKRVRTLKVKEEK